MQVVVRMGEVMGAEHLIDVVSAHVDGCLYHGQVGLDFVDRLNDGEARVQIATTLNVGSLDLLHPELFRGDGRLAEQSRRLMDGYVSLGCRPTWTCAPYQLESRPSLGEDIAWAESNAIVFANSVLGARTNRYGDFIDICAAITGRVPAAGYHLPDNRRATVAVTVNLSEELLSEETTYPILGTWLGHEIGSAVAVLSGIRSDVSEDSLKALGAAAASSGAVALFHVIGVTPEAPDEETATGSLPVDRRLTFNTEQLSRTRSELFTTEADRVDAVSVGTPHASTNELERLAALVGGRQLQIPFYVNTSRENLAAFKSAEELSAAGVIFVTDTCTYVTPILAENLRVVMTNSAKWAYYAPGNLGIDVAFGSLAECVDSALSGRIVHHV